MIVYLLSKWVFCWRVAFLYMLGKFAFQKMDFMP